MRHILLSALLGTVFSAAAFAQASPTAATPALQVTRPIYAWKTENDTDKKTGAFNHCLVKNMYDNGTVLMLAENYEGVKRLALNFPQDKMTAGAHFDLTLQVDKRDVFPVEAVAISPQILTIGIPDALPDQMRKGQAVYLRGPNDEVVYTLDGADGAVTALQDCVATQKGQSTQLQTADADQLPPEQPKEEAAPTAIEPPPEKPPVAIAPPAPVAAEEPIQTAKAETPSAVSTALESIAKKLPGLNDDKKIDIAEEPGEKQVKFEAPPLPPIKPVDAPIAKPVEATLAAPVVAAAPITLTPPTAPKAAPVETPPAPAAPVVAAPARAPTPAIATVAPVVPVEAPTLPSDLKTTFEKAGLAPTAFIATPDKNKASKRHLDYAWMKNDLFIGTKEQNSVPDAGMTKTSVQYLRMLKERCTGPFVAEAGDIIKTPSMSSIVVEAACSSGTKDDTIAALLFTNDAKHMRIYFFEAPAKTGAKAIKARDAVLKTLKAN